MASRVTAEDHQEKQQLLPNLNGSPAEDQQLTLLQKALSQTYKSTADLATYLPTGTVLAFQVLCPVLTNLGRCTEANRAMTACLVALCALACFLLSFTDSFRDGATGRVRYGFATRKGLCAIDGLQPLPPELADKYRLKPVDFVHAFVAVLVFAAVAVSDQNVAACFYPITSESMRQVAAAFPMVIGFLASAVFVTFPSTRHGIGFPLTPN